MKKSKSLIEQLRQACAGPTPPFLFHGTSAIRAKTIMESGFSGQRTFWASVEIANIYAKDRAMSDGDQPVLLVAATPTLEVGGIDYDERAIDDPVGRSYDTVRRVWLELGQWKGGWRAGYMASGCVEASPPSVDALRLVANDTDLRALLDEILTTECEPASAKHSTTPSMG